MNTKNAISLRKVIIFLLIFFSLLVITFEASHYARADDYGGETTADQIMAPLDQGYDSQTEVDTSFDNTWWCQEDSCEIDYGAIGGDPAIRTRAIRPSGIRSRPSDPPPSDPLYDYCANLMGAPEYAQPCLDDPGAYGWGRASRDRASPSRRKARAVAAGGHGRSSESSRSASCDRPPSDREARSDLDQQRVALPAAGADRGETEPAAVAAQVVHHRPEDPAAARADRMAERDGAAVHVHALLVGAEQRRRMLRDRRERLVDLDPRDVVDRLAGALERDRGRLRRRAREVGDLVRRRTPARRSSRAARSRARRAHSSLATSTHDAPSLTPGALPAVVVPSGSNTGFERGELLERRVAARALVRRRASPTGTISSREQPGVDRRDRALVRAERPLVLLLARDAELARDERRLLDHVPPVEARHEPVAQSPGRSATRRRAGSRSAPGRARTARSTSTPSRP